jgi:hypothetical protein
MKIKMAPDMKTNMTLKTPPPLVGGGLGEGSPLRAESR